MIRSLKYFLLISVISFLIGSCVPRVIEISKTPASQTNAPTETSTSETQLNITDTPFTPEALQPVIAINPLTGLPVEDASLLDLPAALVSISHFPPSARPQAGLSFAPFVFEIYITEGATRFLTTFYGEFPKPEPLVTGGCETRTEPFIQTDIVLGNRVWWDANQNNLQDAWERGIGGVCINLYDVKSNLMQQTTTDGNGYYAFNVSAGKYFIEVVPPANTYFDKIHAGDEDQDSDVDPVKGRSESLDVTSTRLDVDAGLILLNDPTPSSDLAPPHVGPVRSGRLVYADIANFFPGSCLIFAYASAEVLVKLPKCAFVDHILQGGGYMLEIDELKRLVTERKNNETRNNYESNEFSSDVPAGGKPATRLDVFTAWLNQSAWVFDFASQSYWRYVDTADENAAGVLHPEMDRLTKRQLQFENVIVLSTQHDVISPRNLDIHLEQGLTGDALLFRDGQMYNVRWSTQGTNANETHKPIRFYYPDEKILFPLKPGHTWVIVVTPLTSVVDKLNGNWQLLFSQPPGAK